MTSGIIRVGPRLGAACACGGFIVARPEHKRIAEAIDRHNATGRHYEWRALREATA